MNSAGNERNAMRIKIGYSCAVLAAIALGLGSRVYSEHLPVWISSHLGDALWAAMIYYAFRVLLTRHNLRSSVMLSALFSFGIEFSQLYQADWINGLRSTVPGALILGHGFLWIDLVRYTAGIILAYLLDRYSFTRFNTNR